MKIWNYILKDLRLYKKNFLSNFISLLIFPIALSFFYGLMQERAFESTSTIKKFSVAIEDKDNSQTSRAIREILKDKSFENIMELKEAEEDIQIVIPEGFQKSLQYGEKAVININQVKKDTGIQTHIVEGFLSSITQNIAVANGVHRNIYETSLTEAEKQKLVESFTVKLNEVFGSSSIKEDTIALSNRLNSFEYYSIAMLSFISVLIVVAYSVEFIKERTEGTLKRIYSISINGMELFLGKAGSIFIISTLSVLCYVLFFRLLGKGFKGDLSLLLTAIIVNSLFISTVAGLIISIFKDEKVAKVVLNMLMMVSVMLAGVFFPIDMIDNKFLNTASKLTPNLWIADMYKKLALYNDFSSMLPSVGVLSVVIVISFLIGSYRMSRAWEM